MAKVLVHPWCAYARLQRTVRSRTIINSRTWGLEDSLDHAISTIATDAVPADPMELERRITRAAFLGARHDRRHAAQRIKYMSGAGSTLDPERFLEARSELTRIKSMVDARDFSILMAVGLGYDYDHIASAHHLTSGWVRTRVARLRLRLAV